MWRKAAGYVHPLWQEIYIGHICWGNLLISLIDGWLWIQGSHDIDTPEWTLTWLGIKSGALFSDFKLLNFTCTEGYLRSILLISFLSLYLSVSEDQDMSTPTEIPPLEAPSLQCSVYSRRYLMIKCYIWPSCCLLSPFNFASASVGHFRHFPEFHLTTPELCNCVPPAVGPIIV